MIYPYNEKTPQIDDRAFIGENVIVTGDVTIGADSSIFYNTVIRGDVNTTIIGKKVNIQDLCCLHQSPAYPLILEDDVSIGHQATLHSCHIKKAALIGMASIILDGAIIGEGAFIGAGSLVTQGTVIPPNTLAFGRPAKVIRELTEADRLDMKRIRDEYYLKGQYYKSLQNKLR
ncbi:gamma carbonic anhydrase [Kurthia sibirica]|uniref:Gamma carbonic anhydrase family protein n=1 Tax=Kurthia sibirica TaxID=202750 RepID=A0A2U3AJS1_9BACL|nr:gamma carbonic anhydrase family protein [Kurthia sibirica]PWI24757.1 gamma carbonic anhydrase family protein [Kurthia sibirica]GEK35125.1 gamma carbonic anhydrase family protein [Kurthia sibirica]